MPHKGRERQIHLLPAFPIRTVTAKDQLSCFLGAGTDGMDSLLCSATGAEISTTEQTSLLH